MFVRPRALFGAIAKKSFPVLLPAALGLILALAPQAAQARHHYRHVSLTYPNKDAALIIDGETGKVLYARNAHVQRYPASLTKLMTLYLLFDALQKGKVTLQTPMPVSAHAARQSPVKLYLYPGRDTITVEQAIKAIIVRSANDVAVVIAEKLGGSEKHFAKMMTAEAHKLGMNHTHYANASGLPNRRQITTASDLGILARHIAYDFPQYYHYFATPSFTWKGHSWHTHDNLIGHYEGAEGMKTGYTVMSGFNLVSSIVRGRAHVIGVVMGGRTARMRDREMIRLLNKTWARIDKQPTLVAHNEMPWQAIANGRKPQTIIAGFDIGGALVPKPKARSVAIASTAPDLRPADAVDPNDEDAAESRIDPADDDTSGDDAIADLIAPKPRPRVTLASYEPTPSIPQPTARNTALRGSRTGNSPTAPSPMRALGLNDWTIQIGAYANRKVARAELASYAERSMDILGQAERIVVPFQSVDGHTLYRARFGPFVEREARKVCERLTERGQTCFAATATR